MGDLKQALYDSLKWIMQDVFGVCERVMGQERSLYPDVVIILRSWICLSLPLGWL